LGIRVRNFAGLGLANQNAGQVLHLRRKRHIKVWSKKAKKRGCDGLRVQRGVCCIELREDILYP